MHYTKSRYTMEKMILMKQYFMLIAAMGLTACATTNATSYVGPSGSKTHTAKCSQSPDACFQKASETCKGGYKVVDSYSKAGGLLADVIAGPVTWYYMTYICGSSGSGHLTFPFRGQTYTPTPIIYTKPTYTNCQRFGNSVSCQSY